ncbi:MAG: DUF560 domain-containing protein [Halieaceae bacterium]|nr:DUF560 domain-containing protein [Halieaceae bacterium]
MAAYALALTSVAAETENPSRPISFSAEIGVGVEYDSNVGVEEVDLSSNQSDYALTLDAELGLKKPLSSTTDLSLSYDFSQSLYQEFSAVDRQTHILGANLETETQSLNTGITLFYINSRLDSEAFLELYRISPSISGFLSKKWFARGAYVYWDKSFENRPGRDASTNTGEADIYYFRNGLRSYFNLGYRFKDEDADLKVHDFSSHNLKLRYIHRLVLFSRMTKLELAWRYEDRDYSTVTPGIEEERSDHRHRWRAEFEVPVLDNGAIQIHTGYSDYDSNLPQADYSQVITGVRFLHRW